MIKIFLSNGLLLNKIGEFCIIGYKNEHSQCFVTSVISKDSCDHRSCLGITMDILDNSKLCINGHRNSIFPSGDNTEQMHLLPILILVYDELEIVSIIPYCTMIDMREFGVDVMFLFRSLSRNNYLSFPTEDIKSNEDINDSVSKSTKLLSKVVRSSYLYRISKLQFDLFSKGYSAGKFFSLGFQIIMSILLVYLLKNVFQLYGDLQFYHENLKIMIYMLVKFLQDLLIWLMGVPVGFKLNRPLSRVMGQFYMFHVTIWENYMMSLIYPFIPFLTGLIPFFVPFGICFFLCLFLDILSLFSLHILCFYVYACKLYRLQVIIICSLYRLFHGQKWNPFRQRVDTGPPEIDRMFVSTLILALSVFLLPTTAIYYLVFVTFKLILLLIEYIVCSVIEVVLWFPVLDCFTYIFHHPSHRKVLEIQQISMRENSINLLIKFHRIPFLSIFRNKKCPSLNIRSNTGIADIVVSLIKGTTL